MSRVVLKHLASNFQGLPRLPVPKLGDTMARYRAGVKHLKKKDVEKHIQVTNAFERGVGIALQEELLEQDAQDQQSGAYPFSYIERIWDDGYLGFRGPSPVNISPAFSLKTLRDSPTQAQAAARVSSAIANWVVRAARDGIDFTPGVDTTQIQFQFCTSRVPGEVRDSIFQLPLEQGRHVTALHHGKAYLVQVVSDSGCALSPQQLESAFQGILSVSPSDDHAAVAALTAGSRSDWAASYSELGRNEQNLALLRMIEGSLVVVCLDAKAWDGDNDVEEAMLIGSSEDCANRWYDKHQVIVSKNGRVALNFEHAFSDGATWGKWLADVWSTMEGWSRGAAGDVTLSLASQELVTPVKFSIGKSFSSRTRTANQEIKKLADNVSIHAARLSAGKKDLKRLKFSPDAFAQACFHHAYFKVHGKIAPTYESCSTAKFFHGRTETIRTATAEMHSLLTALEDGTSDADCFAHLQKAAEMHHSLAKAAAQGQGIDRHLIALQKLAEAKQTPGCEFFKEELFNYTGTWLMSTSNVSLPFLEFFNFGPVTKDGYGIGYVVDDNEIRASVSSWKESSLSEAGELKSAMEMSAQRLLGILSKHAASR